MFRTRFSFVCRLTAVLVSALLIQRADAQNFRLDLALVMRTVSPSGVITDVQTGGTIAALPGTVFRIELRYRITDLVSDTTASRGLSSSSINISRTGGGSWTRAVLNLGQEDQGAQTTPVNSGAQNPDNTGAGLGGTGLMGFFRGGLTNDNDAVNGGPTLGANSFAIVPLALSAPGHQSWTGAGNTNIGPANTNTNPASWGLFAFNYTYQGGNVTIVATAVPDSATNNRFGYFARTAAVNNPVPQVSTLATDASISFVDLSGPCCTPLGGCSITLPLNCTSPNVFVGSGGLCGPGLACPQPVGACCTGGVCATSFQSACVAGVFRQNTACIANFCVPGACCSSSGSCDLRLGADCIAPLSFLGAGTTCSPNPCPQPGACCFPNQCTVLLSNNCTAQGGTFAGAGTSCIDRPCPEACCFPGFTCLVGIPASCTASGGVPTGISTCQPQLCCPAPVINSQSPSQPFLVPGPLSLSVQASHPGTLTYQWSKDSETLNPGPRISGTQSPTLTLSSTIASDAGSYTCLITSSCGRSITTAPIIITVCTPPTVNIGAPTVTAAAGSTASLSVSAGGPGTLSYR